MTLIVEDGTGLNDAESYGSVADSLIYHTNMGNTSWAAFTEPNQEVYLRRATQYLDTTYGAILIGTQINPYVQALEFGRITDDDVTYPAAMFVWPIPIIVQATFELALIASSSDLFNVAPVQQVKSVKVGPITRELYEPRANSQRKFVKINRLLRKYLRGSLNSINIERAS